MKKISGVLLTLLLFTLFGTSVVSAQNYQFSVDTATINVYWNSDGTVNLDYTYWFKNGQNSAPLDYLDFGLPNGTYLLSDVTANIDGNTISDISNSADPQNLTLGLGSNAIQSGMQGVVTLRINNLHPSAYTYERGTGENYVSVRIIPAYFGSDFVNGATNMLITFHLPQGVQPGEPRWEPVIGNWSGNLEPQIGVDMTGRITYNWQSSNASPSQKYEFLAAFPAGYVPSKAAYAPPPVILEGLVFPTAVFLGSLWAFVAVLKEKKEGITYKPKWWIFIFVLGNLAIFVSGYIVSSLDLFTFESIPPSLRDLVYMLLIFLPVPFFVALGYWMIKGVSGGVILANKKLRGGGWLWIWVFLPVVLIPAYLVIIGIFGDFTYAWGRNALYSKKKCLECKTWIPREAIRCAHCGQIVSN